jgi:hypothetical protein
MGFIVERKEERGPHTHTLSVLAVERGARDKKMTRGWVFVHPERFDFPLANFFSLGAAATAAGT